MMQFDSTAMPSGNGFQPLTGKRFGRLTVEAFAGQRGFAKYWNVKCDCGGSKIVAASNITTGKIVSCGCFRLEANHKAKFIELAGQRYGRLTIGEFAEFRGAWSWWHATCDCGTKKIVKSATLRMGKVRSCGCLASELTSERNTKLAKQNGEAAQSTIEYRTWQSMKNRCYNPKNTKHQYYGALDVTVCDRWLASYADFLADVGRRPPGRYSIDRYPDNNGNYEPGNVRWATYSEQNSNRRPWKRRWRSKPKEISL